MAYCLSLFLRFQSLRKLETGGRNFGHASALKGLRMRFRLETRKDVFGRLFFYKTFALSEYTINVNFSVQFILKCFDVVDKIRNAVDDGLFDIVRKGKLQIVVWGK